MFSFYIPWKYQKTVMFFDVFKGGITAKAYSDLEVKNNT